MRESHEYRYRLAGGFTTDADVVLDAACGTGYGKNFLKGKWIGVDREDLCGNVVADLNTWRPTFPFDVFVGFETIEHLYDPSAYVETAKRAGLICLSTPIVPTVHRNAFHLRDYSKADIEALFSDRVIVHYEEQAGLYGIWVFS